MEEMNTADFLLTAAETARLLRVSEKQVYHLLNTGKLVGSCQESRWRISWSTIQKYLTSNDVSPEVINGLKVHAKGLV